jgi:hypothetical protein
MTMISQPTLMFLLIATVALMASTASAGMARPRNMIQAYKYQALQQMLSIGDDPNEAIYTNILLNMEGI